MARIDETKGRKDENSGYVRLLGSPRLGQLISRVHATTIRTGTQLEHLLEAETPSELKAELDEALWIAKTGAAAGRQVVFKPKIKKTKGKRGIIGDVLVFDHTAKSIDVVEIKDGDTFDTKKASGELASLIATARQFGEITGYKTSIHFCSFNQESKDTIVAGAKGRFSPDQVRAEQQANLQFFADEIASIPEVADLLRKRLL